MADDWIRFIQTDSKRDGTLAGAALKGRNGMKKPVYRNISAGGKVVTG